MTMRTFLAALVIALAVAPSGAADYRDSYKAGVEAFEAGRWQEAVSHLRAAIAERDEARGGGFRRYLPYYYLGAALAELGDCRSALDAWAESERQGQISKAKDEYADLLERKAACDTRLQRISQAVEGARQAISGAEAAEAEITTLRERSELAAIWGSGERPTLESLEQQAARLLRQARERLEQVGEAGALEVYGEIQDKAAQATQAFRDVAAEARTRLGAVRQATEDALGQLEEAEASARRVVRSLQDLAPYPRELGRRVAAVEEVLERITEEKAEALPAQIQGLSDELTVALSQLRRAARRPPEQLTEGAEAYLAGEYGTALEHLEEVASSDRRVQGHLCLLRSASRYALYALGGERDEALLAQAEADLEPCAELEGAAEPTEKYFSPRYLAFYRGVRARLAEAAAAADRTDTQPAEGSP